MIATLSLKFNLCQCLNPGNPPSCPNQPLSNCHNQIKVLLPTEQCTKYKGFKNEKSKYPLLHSIFVVPALVEAISAMQTTDPEDDRAHRPWFITLEQELAKLSQTLHEPLDNLYEFPTRTAHILLENNSGIALKALETLA